MPFGTTVIVSRSSHKQVAQLRMSALKNQALKGQEKKLRKQLQQKKEAEKVDEEIFLDYSKPMLHINWDELRVKSVKAQRLLSSHMERLQRVTSECEGLNTAITRKRQMAAKIEEEIRHAEEECLKAESLNRHLQRHLSDYGQGPDVMEHFHVKEKHKRLQRSVHMWERKVGVAELALKMDGAARSKQAAIVTPVSSAEAGARSDQGHIPGNPHME
ncbi:coiled-coil domain-containing protein 113-like [Salarias fasciatus]|uniref:coiled-coil domain-containing protein 113-like n=1 Tax=Salarias fasciatus TaxID=181472 RepID=UPI001176B956|nr:coiled-coil domain-containing protein 113-like [Salarias fasciatus]